MGCCEDKPIKKYTPVPVKGDAGDSNGYLVVAPEQDEAYVLRYRLPFAWILAIVALDSVPAEAVLYRMAATGDGLDDKAFVKLNTSVQVPADTTIEVQILTPKAHGVVTFQVIKQLPV